MKKTPETVKKLEEVFAIDGTVEEACYYADISKQCLYNWFDEDPKFKEKVDRLRNRPVLKARQAVFKGLDNYQNSMDYLKRKKKLEFGDNIDVTTQGLKITPIYGGLSGHTIDKENISTKEENKSSNGGNISE